MPPEKPLPYSDVFSSPDEYIEKLLEFVSKTDVFQILCGGVHILDFFTIGDGLFHKALPKEWHEFLLSCDIMRLLDMLARDDLDDLSHLGNNQPPASFLEYVRTVRNLSLSRIVPERDPKPSKIVRTVSVGMRPKKIHEVTEFSDYVVRLSKDVAEQTGEEISHFVDFGSGQNYLGRALASEPYNRHVIAVEGREHNVTAAKGFDVSSGMATPDKVMRNKKLWLKVRNAAKKENWNDPEVQARVIAEVQKKEGMEEPYDFRPKRQLGSTYEAEEGKGFVQYISGRLDSGDLAEVIQTIDEGPLAEDKKRKLNLMAVSIHSCGNLSHHAIRSLLLNPDMSAVAIVGCCYNLLTEKLGPPTYKHPFLRPTLQAVNGRVSKESDKHDPQGFPMSERFSKYNKDGIRLNITARMMACQALQNWTEKESDGFFTRHFYRAVAQKMFLDRGVVNKVRHRERDPGDTEDNPFDMSTNPVIIGSLKDSCYASLKTYIRGAVAKVVANQTSPEYSELMQEKMGNITDEEIEVYEKAFMPRKKEVSVTWSLMAFSAIVVESLIVTDRWTWLSEREEIKTAWAEPVFDFEQSPRNMVVVGIKK